MAADIDQPGGQGQQPAHQDHRKDKAGKYAIALPCEDKHNQPDSVDVKTVRIYKVLGAFQQPDQAALPSVFKPDVTVSSGSPAAHPKPRQKGH